MARASVATSDRLGGLDGVGVGAPQVLHRGIPILLTSKEGTGTRRGARTARVRDTSASASATEEHTPRRRRPPPRSPQPRRGVHPQAGDALAHGSRVKCTRGSSAPLHVFHEASRLRAHFHQHPVPRHNRQLFVRWIKLSAAASSRRAHCACFLAALHVLHASARIAAESGRKRETYSAPEVAAGDTVLHGQAILTVGDGRPVGHGEDARRGREDRKKLLTACNISTTAGRARQQPAPSFCTLSPITASAPTPARHFWRRAARGGGTAGERVFSSERVHSLPRPPAARRRPSAQQPRGRAVPCVLPGNRAASILAAAWSFALRAWALGHAHAARTTGVMRPCVFRTALVRGRRSGSGRGPWTGSAAGELPHCASACAAGARRARLLLLRTPRHRNGPEVAAARPATTRGCRDPRENCTRRRPAVPGFSSLRTAAAAAAGLRGHGRRPGTCCLLANDGARYFWENG